MPVPVGNESFDAELVLDQAGPLHGELGLSDEQFLARGRAGHDDGDNGEFGLTPLALRLAAHCNGVSRLHGQVAQRQMWSGPGWRPTFQKRVNVGMRGPACSLGRYLCSSSGASRVDMSVAVDEPSAGPTHSPPPW